MTEIITLTISKELRDKIDRTRGDIPRSKFISRSLEAFFKDIEQSTDLTSKVLYKQVAAVHQTNCEMCMDIHINSQNSKTNCRCKCHKDKSQVSEMVGGSLPDTVGSSSFQEEAQNDYTH